MDGTSLFVIVAIIVAVVILDFNRRQKNRITRHLHNDNLKQLLTIAALEYKLSDLQNIDENEKQLITNQVVQLIDGYENGDLPADVFQKQMNSLLQIN